MTNLNNNDQAPGLLCLKDIQKITGRSLRTAIRITKKIKLKAGVDYVTIEAFCDHTGFSLATVSRLLQNKK